MILIGLVLLIVAVVFGVDLILKNSHHISAPAVLGHTLGIHNEATLFVLGAITGAVIILGVAFILSGIRRKGTRALRRHQERNDAKGARSDRDDLVSDNERLRHELAQQRTTEQATPAAAPVIERPVEVTEQPVKQPGASRLSDH